MKIQPSCHRGLLPEGAAENSPGAGVPSDRSSSLGVEGKFAAADAALGTQLNQFEQAP